LYSSFSLASSYNPISLEYNEFFKKADNKKKLYLDWPHLFYVPSLKGKAGDVKKMLNEKYCALGKPKFSRVL